MIDFKNKIRMCADCGEIKPFSDFYFDKKNGKPQSLCKKCKIKNVLKYCDPAQAREKYRKRKGMA